MAKNVLVIGAGAMGTGIAQVTAEAGNQVWLCDVAEAYIAKSLARVKKNLLKKQEKGQIESADAILARIQPITDPQAAGTNIDFVIEAIIENVDAKRELFSGLDGFFPASTIFASNTSAISITEVAAATQRNDRFIGMHFFNPVPMLKLVELTKGILTSAETYAAAEEFVLSLGKTPVEVVESPGFIVNRLLLPMINEAILVLSEGVASAEDIDQALILGANHPMGPLALADHIGLDVCLAVMETLYRDFADSKYRPAPLLKKMVKANLLGRKTNQGFFKYNY